MDDFCTHFTTTYGKRLPPRTERSKRAHERSRSKMRTEYRHLATKQMRVPLREIITTNVDEAVQEAQMNWYTVFFSIYDDIDVQESNGGNFAEFHANGDRWIVSVDVPRPRYNRRTVTYVWI